MLNFLDTIFNYRPNRSMIASVRVDAATRENHEYTAQITSYPVESGVSISDHIYLEPFKLQMEGEVTNTPVAVFGIGADTSGNRVLEVRAELEDLYRSREPFTVVTGLAVYTNMFFTSLSFPRDPTTGQRLQFVAELQQIDTVDTEIVALSARKVANSDHQGKQDVGRTTGAATAVTKPSSVLNDWLFR